jgi:hypothetical protein
VNKKTGRVLQTNLATDVKMLGPWASPATRAYRFANLKTYEERGGGKKGEQLNNQAVHLSGPPANGCPAGTGSGGQLNPAFSLWLMGYPAEWDD